MKRLLALLLLAACGRAPVDAPLGGFTIHLAPEEGRFSIARQDGTLIVDSLPAQPYTMGKPPIGVAWARQVPEVQQQYGSYLFAPSTSAWTVAGSFGDVTVLPDEVSATLADDGRVSIRANAPSRLEITISAAPPANSVSLALRTPTGEHLLGLGAHTQDLDERGGTVPAWTSEQGIGQADTDEPPAAWFLQGTRHQSYFPVPFLISSRGFGLELEGVQRAIFSLESEAPELLRIESWDRSTTLSLYDGPTIPEVLARRTDKVGRPPPPPNWAFAPWNDAIYGESNVQRVANVLRSNHIPSSAVWTEDWAGGVQTGASYSLTYEWKVDRGLYPNVETLASSLHDSGFKFLAYFNTFVESDTSHFAEARDAGYLVSTPDHAPYLFQSARFVQAGLLDLSNAAARDYLSARMSAAIDLGFDGWMADYAEWLPTDSLLSSGEAGLDVHNRYPVDWQRLNESVFAARSNADQLLSFVRSGYAGSAAVKHQVVWGGDQLASFRADDGLPTVIPLALGLGLSGLPYFGSDIGGYTNVDGSPPRSKELFFRWTSLGAFSVLMRTHHGGWPMQNWSLESDLESIQHFGRWARVHIRLFPYLRGLADLFTMTGLPIMRPLALDFPDEDAAYADKTEMMLGPALLVAPVTDEGATARSIYLPAATWLPVTFGDDGTPRSAGPAVGGGTSAVIAAVTEIPVYLRAGSMVPLLPPGVETLSPVDDAAGVVGLTQAGSARTLLIGLGAAPNGGPVSDDLGASYTLTASAAPTGTPTFLLDGLPIGATADAHGARVVLGASGTLVMLDGGKTVASLSIAARPAAAISEIIFVW